MAYDRSYWKDHVTDQSGEVIQQGTLLDQQHLESEEEQKRQPRPGGRKH